MGEEEEPQEQQVVVKKGVKKVFLVISCILLSLGGVGGPLFLRLYFVHGGKRVWFSSFLETAGFPILLIPLAVNYVRSGRRMPMIKPTLFLGSAVVGILTGVDDYLYAYGVARLPVSTSALIIASQLAFTAGFALVLVRQKFTAFSVNAVVLLTIGAGVLALHSSGDRPAGESSKEYLVGFLTTLGAAMLYGFMLPLVELLYSKTMQAPTYMMLLQSQFVISLFATLFCFAGMLINHDLKVIGREAREYEVGEVKYYFVVVGNAIMWQAFFLGAIGVIVCASSLLSGIIIALLIPVTEVCAVIFFKESFHAEKGLSLLLSLWGFVSYFYGEFKHLKKLKKNTQTHTPPPLVDNP